MKSLKFIGLLIVAGLLMFGCATGGVDTSDIPDFYLNPPAAEDAIYGVGDAKMSTLSLSRTMALSRARDDIARQVEVLVKNAITDYAQEAGEGDNKQTIEFIETVSRQLVEVTLKGLKTKEVAVGKDGTVYALVEYPINTLLDAANETFARNEASAFAEFKADQALQKMNSELQNNPPQAGGN